MELCRTTISFFIPKTVWIITEVDVEITGELFSDRIRELESLQKRLTDAIAGTIGLRVKVKLVAPQTIQRSEGKARRVIDHRNK